MKILKISLLLITSILFGCNEKTTGWDFENLKGKPTSVTKTEKLQYYENGEWVNSRTLSTTYSEEIIFDKNGMILKEKRFTDDELRSEYDYNYKDDGAIRIQFAVKENAKVTEDKFTILSGFFKVSSAKSKNLDSGKIYYEYSYEWDEENRIKKIKGMTRDTNHVSHIEERFYNENDAPDIIKTTWLYETKPKEQYEEKFTKYEYDEIGNWVSRIKINPHNKTIGRKEQRIILYH